MSRARKQNNIAGHDQPSSSTDGEKKVEKIGATRVQDPSLPKGWEAYICAKYMHIYYFNRKTGQSVWERPTDEHASDTSQTSTDDSSDEDAPKGRAAGGADSMKKKRKKKRRKKKDEDISKQSHKIEKKTGKREDGDVVVLYEKKKSGNTAAAPAAKTKNSGGGPSRRNGSTLPDVVEALPQSSLSDESRRRKLAALAGYTIPKKSAAMEVEIADIPLPPPIDYMEVDEIDAVIKVVRQESDQKPIQDDGSSWTRTGVFDRNARMIVVFDTSALMESPEIIPFTIQRQAVAVIPYKVVGELDGLKKHGCEKVRQKAQRNNTHLDRLSKAKETRLVLESSFQAREMMAGLDVSSPDDYILKCALRIHQFLSGHDKKVYFVTRDRNLAVKARSNGLTDVMEPTELIECARRHWSEAAKGEKTLPSATYDNGASGPPTVKVDDLVGSMVTSLGGLNGEGEKRQVTEDMDAVGVYHTVLRDTLTVVYSEVMESGRHHFARFKAVNDLKHLQSLIQQFVRERSPEMFKTLFGEYYNRYQYYVVRSPFPPPKMNMQVLMEGLQKSIPIDIFYKDLEELNMKINNLPCPTDLVIT